MSGTAGRELYLECLQLILRRQLAWLVAEKGFPPQAELVVRDLWDLRLRNFYGLRKAADGDGDGSRRPGTSAAAGD